MAYQGKIGEYIARYLNVYPNNEGCQKIVAELLDDPELTDDERTDFAFRLDSLLNPPKEN